MTEKHPFGASISGHPRELESKPDPAVSGKEEATP